MAKIAKLLQSINTIRYAHKTSTTTKIQSRQSNPKQKECGCVLLKKIEWTKPNQITPRNCTTYLELAKTRTNMSPQIARQESIKILLGEHTRQIQENQDVSKKRMQRINIKKYAHKTYTRSEMHVGEHAPRINKTKMRSQTIRQESI